MHSTAEPSFHDIRSDALRTLLARGYVNQCTDLESLDAALSTGVVPAYIGFDATADSLHVGHLLQIMTLRQLQRHGHKPIVLVGGGTTRIGDPSFRTESRPLLSDEEIARNIRGIRSVFDRFLTFGDGPTDAILVNNAEWLDRLGYISMLRDIGRHFSVGRMLSFDSVKSRLERQEGLSFLEFNYMILQACDFLELTRRNGCRLQMGGSDQWGNIINGVELVRRVERREVFGLTTPLLTTASGAKMGKTAAGAVWLNADRLSPYEYWQFWRNTDDADVPRFLKLFTDLPLDEIGRIGSRSDINAAKRLLADETTKLAHGADAAGDAAETARLTFEGRLAAEGLPTLHLNASDLSRGISVLDLLVSAGFTSSRGEGRRLVKGAGVRIDDTVVSDENLRLDASLIGPERPVRLSVGRKRHLLLRVQ